jgi:hypothetical protein
MFFIKVFFLIENQLCYCNISELVFYSYITQIVEINNESEFYYDKKDKKITKNKMLEYLKKYIYLWINDYKFDIICIDTDPSDNELKYNTIIDEYKKILIINNITYNFEENYKNIIEGNELLEHCDIYMKDEIDYIPNYNLKDNPKIRESIRKLEKIDRLYKEDFKDCIRKLKNNYFEYDRYILSNIFENIIKYYNDYINYKNTKKVYLLEIIKLCNTINNIVTKKRKKFLITKNFDKNIIDRYGPKYSNDFNIKIKNDCSKKINTLKYILEKGYNIDKVKEDYYDNLINTQICRHWRYEDNNYKKIPYKILVLSANSKKYRINQDYSRVATSSIKVDISL